MCTSLGRRVQKKVYAYGSGNWVEQSTKKFVYDGWNLIAELDGAGEVTRYFVWGMDLSQSRHGAGGIGGLICVVDSFNGTSSTYHYYYDGNGNVGQVTNGSDGSIVASYEYDAFGKTIKYDGVYASINSFRFSTKFYEDKVGLYYYGSRFYNSNIGRWVSLDPIKELGGINLYAFVSNNSINMIDAIGFEPGYSGIKGALLKLGEKYRKKALEDFFEQWGDYICQTARNHNLDPVILFSILTEELSHQLPGESMAEYYLDKGNTVGPGQIYYDVWKDEMSIDSRDSLKSTSVNIDITAEIIKTEQSRLENERGTADIDMLGTRYNAGKNANTVSDYGRRIQNFYNKLAEHVREICCIKLNNENKVKQTAHDESVMESEDVKMELGA